jgi:hypothetical protein
MEKKNKTKEDVINEELPEWIKLIKREVIRFKQNKLKTK